MERCCALRDNFTKSWTFQLWLWCKKHWFSPFLFTYNLIWRRCAGYIAFHLSSLPSHGILDWITGDDGRTCSGQKISGYVNFSGLFRGLFFHHWHAYSTVRSTDTQNYVAIFWPLTVRVTSVSPARIRGTMALHTYWPASAWLTDFRYSWLLLLRTCGGVKNRQTNINNAKLLYSRRR